MTAQICKLTGNIIVANVDEPSLFTGEGMIDRHSLAAAIAVPRHVQRCQVISKADVVPKLLHR